MNHTRTPRAIVLSSLALSLLGASCARHASGDPTAAGSTKPNETNRIAATTAAAGGTDSVKSDKGMLHHEKYTLPNGMIVILHEDHSLPVATINTWYRVGAKNEPKGRSGFAHLFEHLMFMGTHRVPGSDFDNLMEAGGGANNASTSLDRTNYYSWGPSSLLPTLLWLDADRLEDLGSAMNAEKLKKQLDVVRNEIRQNVENTPYGRANEYANRFMYPETHPYFWNAYGLHEDLEAATVENVKDFFATFYVPNNASLVVAGDFDSAKIKPMIAQMFGTLPRGNVPQDKVVPTPKMDRVVRTTMLDKCQLPMLMICYMSPAQFKPGDAEMDLAAAVLGAGQNSRLYKRLVVQDQIAVSVGVSQESQQLGSLFRISVLAKPDADLTRLEQIIDDEIASFCKTGPTADELKQRQAERESGMLNALQSLMTRADKLNEYEYFFGNPDSVEADLNRYRTASSAGIADWSKKTLTPDARLITRVLPEETQREKGPRDTRPADMAAAPFTAPAPQSFVLSNGIKAMFWPKPGSGLVSATALFAYPQPIDAVATAGLSHIMTDMLTEGTKGAGNPDGAAYTAQLQQLGAAVGAGAGTHTASVSLNTLSRTFDQSATLWADAILRPKMDAKDFDRVKANTLDDLKQQDDEPAVVAGRVGMRILFGDKNPYGWPGSGTVQTVTSFDLTKTTSTYRGLIRPDVCTVLISGDITVEQAKATLEKQLGTWTDKSSVGAMVQNLDIPAAPASGMRFVIVDRPGAVQTMVRYYAPSVPAADEKRVPLSLINTILGGSFTSRLNQNLREKNGFTYGARSSFSHTRDTGWFSSGAGIRSDATGAALKEFASEFKKIRAGDITDADVTKAKNTIRTDTVRAFSTIGSTLGVATGLIADNLPWSSITADLAALDKYSASDLNKLAGPNIALEKGVLVLVGDKKSIMPQLEGLGLPAPVEVDAHGVPVKK